MCNIKISYIKICVGISFANLGHENNDSASSLSESTVKENHEIYMLFELTKPRIAFCQYESHDDYVRAAKALNLDTIVVTFDKGEFTFDKLMESCNDESSEEFKPATFDLDKVFAWLVSTSGTTGRSKVAAFKHRPLVETFMRVIQLLAKKRKATESNMALQLSPVQWISGFFGAINGIMMNQIKLTTSAPQTLDHIIDVINKYKPVTVTASPLFLADILNHEKKCDLTCFNNIMVTGVKVYKDLLINLKKHLREDTLIMELYGQTESLGPVLQPIPFGPSGSCGMPVPWVDLKLVDIETGKEITEPNKPGELWTKGPRFAEYYKNPEETAKVITADGWFRTGDLLYRDEDDYYYFVERIKTLIKYRSSHVIPVELEELIRTHPSVHDVCVTSVPHEQDGEHPVACVVRRPGRDVTAQEIKKLVADKLSDSKQLRGGVIFIDEMPMTSSGKVARVKAREIVLNSKRKEKPIFAKSKY